MSKLKEIYLELCMSAVFSKVLSKPLFLHFARYCQDDVTREEKIRAYAAFVSEIYNHGGSLTYCTLRYLFEDENIYIIKKSKREKIAADIEVAYSKEIRAFERFAALTSSDFAADLGVEYVSPFSSDAVNFRAEYDNRIVDIEKHGYGIFAFYPMFRLADNGELEPIVSADKTTVDAFIGYSEERQLVIDNTRAFLLGRPAANCLLCGDAGTGKSSTVKAVANYFYEDGIRLIELRKDQLSYLPYVMGKISENPLKFIIFIDDLSFNKSDDNFSMLKAALEGSASAKAENAVIYATSNRRHIVKETFGDREGEDVHRNDTMQENLSLSERFGLVVLFQKPNKQLYLEIVHSLAKNAGILMDKSELDIRAEAFALRKGNRSARCAEQFINSLL